MRIYKAKYYISETVPGISGFQQWDKRDLHLVTGVYAQGYRRVDVVREYVSGEFDNFRLENGTMPEYQPTVSESEALVWLESNPYGRVYLSCIERMPDAQAVSA